MTEHIYEIDAFRVAGITFFTGKPRGGMFAVVFRSPEDEEFTVGVGERDVFDEIERNGSSTLRQLLAISANTGELTLALRHGMKSTKDRQMVAIITQIAREKLRRRLWNTSGMDAAADVLRVNDEIKNLGRVP